MDGPFASSVGGLGDGEAARSHLTPAAVRAVVERELDERRDAAAEYERLGRHEQAAALSAQAEALAAVAAEAG